MVILVAFLAIQFVPVARENPAERSDLAAPDAVKTILKKSCYDCHSNETVWPWYSYVAPVSWLVAHDVKEAREHLNFSSWGRYAREERNDYKKRVIEEVEGGDMPLWYYVWMHPSAKLGEQDLTDLREWAKP